jgi:uncharacterized protein (TIGR02145 family)
VVIAFSINALSQVPEKMSYQCIVRNASGVLVTNQSVGIRISILQGTATGTVVYQETYSPNPTTNANGLVSLEIGGGLSITETFSAIDWASGPYFLKTETDPTGGTNYTIVGTSQLLSVPYALYAGNGISNSVLDGLKLQIKALEDNLIASGTYKLIDIEGNQYKVVKIGNQVWMAENLKVTHYNDGTSIPYFGQYSYDNQHSYDGYGWYNNDPSTYKNTYGALYNFPAVATYKLCPTGWQVPSESEWGTLITFLGGDLAAGGKLKETGTTHWNSPNTGATNETGFTALPGGIMFTEGGNLGTFQQMGTNGYWWSRKQQTMVEPESFYERLDYNLNNSYGMIQYVWNGLSVRCLKDAGPTLTTDSVIATRTDAGIVSFTTVKSGGHIIDDNGLVITHKGICWGGATGDEIIGRGTDEGGGSDNFKSTFNIEYNGVMYSDIYIRAYATNAAGTGYGNEIVIHPSTLPVTQGK